MATGLQSNKRKTTTDAVAEHEATAMTQDQDTSREESRAAATHTTGKPTELEPKETSFVPSEAPEAGEVGTEAPDAGYGRCTESSNWEERGRNWN